MPEPDVEVKQKWESIRNLKGEDIGSTMSVANAKPLQRYGSIRRTALVSVSNGSGWWGDIMNGQAKQMELALLNQMGMEELAKILVDLVENNRELRQAVLEVVRSCPNVRTKI